MHLSESLPSPASVARAHRRTLLRRLPDAPIVVGSAPELLRNGDVHFSYRQSSDMLWLTGIGEPGYTLLLDAATHSETLFVPKLTQKHAVWLGHIPSRAEARVAFGIRDVRTHDELGATLKRVAPGRRPLHVDAHASRAVRKARPGARLVAGELRDALDELRIVKDAGERALMRKASAATRAGHLAAMRTARAGQFEYQVQAELERHFRHEGCAQLGYGSIVAGGRNAAVLHYFGNSARLAAGALLLIDAGAEYRGYTADVTRTFPVDGRFDARQRDVYEVVLRAQEACIDAARAGLVSMDLQRLAETRLAEGLRTLSLLKGGAEELVETQAVRVFFPHGISHTLGLDVHDVQGGRRRRLRQQPKVKLRFRARLEPGFAITIEPGVYFIGALLHDPELRLKHRGRVNFTRAEGFLDLGGVRIEDDVLVQAEGPPLNLTEVPKQVADVEAVCAR